nr:MAG TPA: hypothetical protein [Caudoviricetes sp.]
MSLPFGVWLGSLWCVQQLGFSERLHPALCIRYTIHVAREQRPPHATDWSQP